ncbi:hypothetical protein BDZ89DRAFT_1063373 [Hymenopellis radicata]|nr:hypothetical protein BDZ89DRAFT_1063373 [Hymenopellis radicata]
MAITDRRKRRRTTAAATSDDKPSKQALVPRRGRKSVAAVNRFADLPFDVLLEIFSHALPLDILHVSWVCHSLRGVVMTKSSRGTWKAARRNADNMPEPFPGMSEPGWAHFVFIKICNFCWKKKVAKPDFHLRCRICPACSEHHLIARNDLKNSMPVHDRTQVDVIFLLLDAHDTVYQRCKLKDTYALLGDYEDVETELRYRTGSTTKDFILDRLESKVRNQKHADLCLHWYNIGLVLRRKEIAIAKTDRRTAIYEKLSALGYKDDLDIMGINTPIGYRRGMRHEFEDHPLVKQNRPLTDRVLAEKVRNMCRTRERKLIELERKKVALTFFRSFKQSLLTTTRLYPSIADFLLLAPVKAIIDRPGDDSVSVPDFDPILPQMDAFYHTWRTEVHARVLAIADPAHASEHTSPESTLARLRLATNSLFCEYCSFYPDVPRDYRYFRKGGITFKPLFYPEYLTHHCAFKGWNHEQYHLTGGVDDTTCSIDGNLYLRTSLTPQGTYLKKSFMTTLVDGLVVMAGMDPSTATVDDMDSCGVLFECGVCRDAALQIQARHLRSWREMVTHGVKKHFFDSAAFLEELTKMADVPEGWEVSRTVYEDLMYECVHCLDLSTEKLGGQTLVQLRAHIRSVHEQDQQVEGVDYRRLYGMPDTPRRMTMFLKRSAAPSL